LPYLWAVPSEANSDCRHHFPKQRFKMTNRLDHDATSRQRGTFTVSFTDEAVAACRATPCATRAAALLASGYPGGADA
jgi:hypothetical protein